MGLAPKSDNEVMCWLEIKQNPGRAGLEALGRAGPRRNPKKFLTFTTLKTQNSLTYSTPHPRPAMAPNRENWNKGHS